MEDLMLVYFITDNRIINIEIPYGMHINGRKYLQYVGYSLRDAFKLHREKCRLEHRRVRFINLFG